MTDLQILPIFDPKVHLSTALLRYWQKIRLHNAKFGGRSKTLQNSNLNVTGKLL